MELVVFGAIALVMMFMLSVIGPWILLIFVVLALVTVIPWELFAFIAVLWVLGQYLESWLDLWGRHDIGG